MLAALWIFAIEPLLATRKEPSWASSLRWRYRLRKGFAVPLALVWLGEQGGAALPGCLRCSWPKMREMRNCGRARLDTRVQLGSKCGVQDRFRRIETRIRLQSGSCRCNARFFVHHAVFYQACCPRRVASIGLAGDGGVFTTARCAPEGLARTHLRPLFAVCGNRQPATCSFAKPTTPRWSICSARSWRKAACASSELRRWRGTKTAAIKA